MSWFRKSTAILFTLFKLHLQIQCLVSYKNATFVEHAFYFTFAELRNFVCFLQFEMSPETSTEAAAFAPEGTERTGRPEAERGRGAAAERGRGAAAQRGRGAAAER